VLDAAIRAPSGSNEQSWEFVIVKDAAQRKKIGDVYRKGGGNLDGRSMRIASSPLT